MFGAVEAIRETIGLPLPPRERARHDRHIAAVRDALGPEPFAIAWAQGRTMPFDQVIAYALEKPPAE